MTNQLVVAAYGFILIISVVQLATGAVAIDLGKALGDSTSSLYSTFYSLEGGYYIAVGIISFILCIILALMATTFSSLRFSKLTAEFFLLLLLTCFQTSIATYSSINSSVLSSQSDKFSTFTNQQCSFTTLKNMTTSVAVITWLLVCPIVVLLLNWSWQEWKKGLQKDVEAEAEPEPMEQIQSSVRKPLY